MVGASKQQTSIHVGDFYESGLRDFGENYVQEALTKKQELEDLNINWHFIGRIQSNKCRAIAENFNWVHSVDRLKIAKALANASAARDQPLNILIQLNNDRESSKAGITIAQAPKLCREIAELNAVCLRGFMLIPKSTTEMDHQRQPFSAAREAMESINQRYGMNLDTLSMGMSNDLEAAILEGATMIRIGTDLFGARKNPE